MNVTLTIAGSDSGGGAGIQADLKTFQELGTFGTSVITAITSQNTQGVHAVHAIPVQDVESQLKAVLDDFPIQAAKTGMLFSAAIITTVSRLMKAHNIPLVVDPVMIAKGGASLLQQEAITAMKTELLPLATVITPNIPEAEVLTGMTIVDDATMIAAGQALLTIGVKVAIIKGGHLAGSHTARDIIVSTDDIFIVETPFITTKDTHGTGCTFSAALTAELAKGTALREAVTIAKQFIQAAIQHPLHLGSGHGPTNHAAYHNFEKVQVTVYDDL